jgi:hypothetical protein
VSEGDVTWPCAGGPESRRAPRDKPARPGSELRADDLTYRVDCGAVSLVRLQDNIEEREVLRVEGDPRRATESVTPEFRCGSSE